MLALTLRSRTRAPAALRPRLKEAVSRPPPDRDGLAARQLRLEGDVVRARYLFDDERALERFANDLPGADPDLVRLEGGALAERLEAPSVEPLADGAALERPVFVVSAPRAGSTLLYEILAEAEELWTCGGEDNGAIDGVGRLHVANRGFESHRLDSADATPEVARAVRCAFLSELRDRDGRRWAPDGPRPVRLLEKSPKGSLRIPFLNAVFPDAVFVHLERDARPSVSSIVEAWRHGGFTSIVDLPGWDGPEWSFLLPPGWRSLAGRPLGEVALAQWRSASGAIAADLARLPRDRSCVVHYDDLVAAPAVAVERVADAIGVRFGGRLARAARRPRLSSTTVTPPSPVKWRTSRDLRGLAFGTPEPRAPANARRRGPMRFGCFVDAGRAALGQAGPDAVEVDPSFRLQLGPTVPLELLPRTRFRDRFLGGYPVAWVEDPAGSALRPFWAGRAHAHALTRLRPGHPPPADIDPALLAGLTQAGILVAAGAADARLEQAGRAREDFAARGHCTLRELVHPLHARALGRYYAELVEREGWALDDGQVKRRFATKNESVARFFHAQLTGLVAKVVGAPVKPSYAYVAVYTEGAVLKRHVDRAQCEYTISLLADRSDGDEPAPWPLFLETPAGTLAIEQSPADGLLFRGREQPHFRGPLPSGRSTSLLLHYVPETFAGALD